MGASHFGLLAGEPVYRVQHLPLKLNLAEERFIRNNALIDLIYYDIYCDY